MMEDQDRKGSAPGMFYHFYGCRDGVSKGVFSSLNVGFHVGDSNQNVRENRRRIKIQSGIENLVSAHQVHGCAVCNVDMIAAGDHEVAGYDALITTRRDVGLMIQQADCQAVLLYDPQIPAIGAVHSGWRGNVANVVGRTVAAMVASFHCNSCDIRAFISPSLGPCCAEFVHYRDELPAAFHCFKTGRYHFNFWDITKNQLVQAGLKSEKIVLAGICTSCSDDYFSYRRARRQGDGTTGRHCSVIRLSGSRL